MQNPPRYTLWRRILFPYNGDEALTFKQSMRVLFAWMVCIPLLMSLCTLGLTATFAYSLQNIAMFLLFTFLSGCFIFGSLGLLVVITNNASARVRQKRKAANLNNTHGGRYGS